MSTHLPLLTIASLSVALTAPSNARQTTSNEPPGMSVIYDGEIGAWLNEGTFAMTKDESATKSGPNVGRITFPAGFGGGNAPAQVWKAAKAATIYIQTWFKFSPNFQNHPTGINKIIHFFIGPNGGINRIFFMARGNDLVPSFGLQQLASPYTGNGQTATAVHILPNLASARMARGAWHRIEMLLDATGTVSIWLNGTKVLHYTGINFGGSRWEEIKWSPTWGGSGGTVSSEMYIEMDHMYVSGKN